MKRHVNLTLSIALAILLAGCSAVGENSSTAPAATSKAPNESLSVSDEQSDTQAPESTSAAPLEIPERLSGLVLLPGSNGSEMFYTETQLPRYHRVTGSVTLESEYAVYTDPYPIGQGGALYDVNEEDLPRMEKELREALVYFFGDDTASSLEIADDRYSSAEGTAYSKSASHNGIKVSVNPYSCIGVSAYNRSFDVSELIESPASISIVRDAMDCCGITEPFVVETAQGLSIYERADCESDTPFAYCKHIDIIQYTAGIDTPNVYITICRTSLSDYSSSSCRTVSYNDAYEFFKLMHPNADLSSVVCVTTYDKNAYIGYYTPIYDFYFKEPERTLHDLYCRVRIPAVEFTPDIILH